LKVDLYKVFISFYLKPHLRFANDHCVCWYIGNGIGAFGLLASKPFL